MTNETESYDVLKLKNQVCFPLYACSKELVRQYGPYLKELNLTYTQYLVMMVLWERKQVNVKELGECLFLDSGTLTPVLKKLEEKGLVTRERSAEDERNLVVTLTGEGAALKTRALDIPARMGACVRLTPEEAGQLYRLLYKLLGEME